MEKPAPPPYRPTPAGYSLQSSHYEQSGTSNGVPGSFEGPLEPEEEFVEAAEHGDLLPSLGTDEQMRQLEIIDKLQDLGIHHDGVELPRLVVCGDQSSGKSSVLGAITRIPFPRHSDTCTRFVTQIMLRHDPNNFSSEVSIHPGPRREGDDLIRLKRFSEQIASDFSNLPEIIAKASRAIFTQSMQGHMFSDDILKIIIRSKEHQPLEILDLPGLISNDMRGRRDIEAVEAIVRSHIQKQRSIVLVVVGASKDLQEHKVLQEIREIDGCNARAFGIITKPDVPRAQSLETYLDLANNKRREYEYKWGWHVLRNSTIEELNAHVTWQVRDQHEKDFFLTSEWKQLLRQKPYESIEQVLGIFSLRKRVVEMLSQLNQKEIPNVKREIQRRLAVHEARLQELGGERKPSDMREKLFKGGGRIAQMAEDFSRGIYESYGAIDDEKLHLRARIRDLEDEFMWTVHNLGHACSPDHFALKSDSDFDSPSLKAARQRASSATSRFFQPPRPLSQREFYAEGVEFLNKRRGNELHPYNNPQRITLLFERQSEKWISIATQFLGEFYEKCETFLELALRHEFRTEVDVPGRLWQVFLTDNFEKRKLNAQNELTNLLEDRTRPVKTNSIEFQTRSRTMRISKTFANFNNVVREQAVQGPASVMDPESVSRQFGVFTHEESEAAKYNDDMLAYYVLARTLFVDNFLNQVVERHLLHKMSELFKDVHKLSDEDAEEILREREDHRQERIKLVEKIKRLKEARRILN